MTDPDERRIADALDDLAQGYDAVEVEWSSVAERAERRASPAGAPRRVRIGAVAAAALVLAALIGVVVVRRAPDTTVLTQPSSTLPGSAVPVTTGTLPRHRAPGQRCNVPGIEIVNRSSESSPRVDAAETERTARAQSDLWGDLAVVGAYGAQHPEDWAGVQFEFDQPERIQAVFTDHVDAHRAALATQVSHPERLDVRLGCYTKATIDAVRHDLETRLPPGSWTSLGDTLRGIDLGLTAAGTQLAAELWAQYGDILWITVAGFAYPPDPRHTTDARCDAPELSSPNQDVTVPGLELSLAVPLATIESGADFDAELVAHNAGSSRIDLGYRFLGSQRLWVVRRGTRKIVGYRVPRMSASLGGGSGPGLSVEPGQTQRVPVGGGTASCDLTLGYRLPPGEYDVLTSIELYNPHNDTGGKPATDNDPQREPTQYVVSHPTPITIH